jgi:hypothetical protein
MIDARCRRMNAWSQDSQPPRLRDFPSSAEIDSTVACLEVFGGENGV